MVVDSLAPKRGVAESGRLRMNATVTAMERDMD